MRSLFAAVLVAVMPLAALTVTGHSPQVMFWTSRTAVCAVAVKKSLEQVAGVTQVRIDFAKKTATVTFDADKTNATALTKATTNAGYPSTAHK